jgi:hypothetical protein
MTRLARANKVKLTKIALSQKTRAKRSRNRAASPREQQQLGLRTSQGLNGARL